VTKARATSVDACIAAQPAAVRPVLERLRAIIRKARPQAEEGISYQIPVYKLAGRPVIYIAGWKAHVSLYPATGCVATEMAAEIATYKVSKGTLRFPLDKPIPTGPVARIVKLRSEEELEMAAKSKSRSKAKRQR
jgi:uncharacterized protein YdhG (YjbR/CyaY superfamily)